MSGMYLDEAALREIVKLIVRVVLEEMEGVSSGKLTASSVSELPSPPPPGRTGGCGSATFSGLPVADSARSAPDSSRSFTPVPADWTARKLVSEHDIKQLGRNVTVFIGRRTIVTPLASDTARERGIILKRE